MLQAHLEVKALGVLLGDADVEQRSHVVVKLSLF